MMKLSKFFACIIWCGQKFVRKKKMVQTYARVTEGLASQLKCKQFWQESYDKSFPSKRKVKKLKAIDDDEFMS